MRWAAVFALIGIAMGTAACADSVSFDTVCDDYKKMCPNDPKTEANYPGCVAECQREESGPAETKEGCTFWYCAVVVGICDNQEQDDASIMRCMKDHGWISDDQLP